MAKKKQFSLTVLLTAAVIALAAFVVYQNFAASGPTLPKDAISKKIVEVVGKSVGDPKQVVIKKIEKIASLYKISLSVMGQDYESYATLDGKYLFPQKIDLNPPKPKKIPQSQKPEVDLFVMSYCPFGNQAEQLIMPLQKTLGSKANFNLRYIIYSNYSSGHPEYCLDKENKYCSMHGVQEVRQDIRELCVQKYQKDKLWDFVKEMNENSTSKNTDEKWEEIAQKLGIDINKIKSCQEKEGSKLLDKEIALTNKEYPVQDPSQYNSKTTSKISGSPTLVINGVIYDGNRSTEAYQEAICNAFVTAPPECQEKVSNSTTQSPAQGSCE